MADMCAHVLVPEATEVAIRYYNSEVAFFVLQNIWLIAVPLVVLFSGFSGVLSRFSQRLSKYWYFTIAIYLLLYVTLWRLLNLPLAYFSGYQREHAFGLSTQSLTRFMSTYGTNSFVLLVEALLFIWIFYLLLKKSPRRWWLYCSIASIVIMFIILFLEPIFVDPMLHHFGPLKNKELEHQILALAQKAGIEHERVFEVNMSQDTKTLNAYVTGFLGTKRIVLWDTLLNRMTPREILMVTGHEMGHYVLNHMWIALGAFAVGAFLVFYLTYRIASMALNRFHKRFGFNRLDNIASLPLFLVIISVLTFLLMPISNIFSRYLEHEADRFGLEMTRDNQAAGEMFSIIAKEDLEIPQPGWLFKIWAYTHPPLKDRIDFANRYCPWKHNIK